MSGAGLDPRAWLPLVRLPRADSSNDEALRLAAARPDLGTRWLLVVADEQVAGRGRLGHGWFSCPGASLTMSLAAELPLDAAHWPRASLVVGGAVARAVEATCGVAAGLKWPNDLLLRARGRWLKVGGILCERHETAGRALWIAGIGLNVAVPRERFPAALQDHAISLGDVVAPPDRFELALAIARIVRDEVLALARHGGCLPSGTLRDRLLFVGETVELDLGPGSAPIRGILGGLTEDGALQIADRPGGAFRAVRPLSITSAAGPASFAASPALARKG